MSVGVDDLRQRQDAQDWIEQVETRNLFLTRIDVLELAKPGATFLLNCSPYSPEDVWNQLPQEAQQTIIDKQLKFYVIDAYQVAKDTGMGTRINTIMQTCFFAISGVLPREEAIAQIKKAIEKTYAKRGAEVVKRNFEAVDATLAHLHEVSVPAAVTSSLTNRGFGVACGVGLVPGTCGQRA